MSIRPATRIVASVRKASTSRVAAARDAIALCKTFDQLGRDADSRVNDAASFVELLEQRDDVLALLNDHLVALRLERPTADGRLFQGAERAADTADELILQVSEALETSQAATAVLTARIAQRAAELRKEIASVNRVEVASNAYFKHEHGSQLDSRR